MSLDNIFETKIYIKLNSSLYQIRYDMRAFALIDKTFNCLDDVFNNDNISDLIKLLNIGIINNFELDLSKVKLSEKLYIKNKIIEALTEALHRELNKSVQDKPSEKKEAKWQWELFYYKAIVDFRLKEEKFWSMLPKQFFTLCDTGNQEPEQQETKSTLTKEDFENMKKMR